MRIGRQKIFLAIILVITAISSVFFTLVILKPKARVDSQLALQPGRVKLSISEDALYRVPLRDLQEAGLTSEQISIGEVNLRSGEKTIPYWLVDGDLVFYGQAPTDRYSISRAYILEVNQPGHLMEEVASPAMVGPPLERISQDLHVEENLLYDGRTVAADTSENSEPWYWITIQPQAQEAIEFSLPDTNLEPATLTLRLWGATQNYDIDYDHDLNLIINGLDVGTIRWDGESHFTDQITIPPGALREGKNTLLLDNTPEGAAPIDVMRLDWLEVTYDSLVQVEEDKVFVSGDAGLLSLHGFEGEPLVYDVSDPDSPKIVTDWELIDGNVRLGITPDMKVIAAGPNGYKKPDRIEPLRSSNLHDSENQADLLIVTTESLSPALEPLIDARKTQGLSVHSATIEEINDEFGHGQAGPDSIAKFVRFAFENWRDPAPRYLLLVGDASYDYKNYLGRNPSNIVPSPMVPVRFSGETVSDARLADVDNDGRPDLAVGRWPVDDPDAVSDLIERTLAYESGSASNQAIFAADASSQEFANLNDSVLEGSHIDKDHVERLIGADASAFVDAWNDGAWLVTYAGHGSLDRWGKDGLFQSQSVGDLQSAGTPPIMIQLTCLTGFFAHPIEVSLSETMLQHENGPVLIVGATSLTLSSRQQPFGINLVSELQQPGVERIGDAFLKAKDDLGAEPDSDLQEVIDTFGLLGDPSTLIVRPAGENS